MKQMMDQLTMQFEMVKVMLEGKASDERGDAVQWILIVLAGIAIVGIVVAAITTYVQNQSEDCLYLNLYVPTEDGKGTGTRPGTPWTQPTNAHADPQALAWPEPGAGPLWGL
mgnify:CR=1 FL=1